MKCTNNGPQETPQHILDNSMYSDGMTSSSAWYWSSLDPTRIAIFKTIFLSLPEPNTTNTRMSSQRHTGLIYVTLCVRILFEKRCWLIQTGPTPREHDDTVPWDLCPSPRITDLLCRKSFNHGGHLTQNRPVIWAYTIDRILNGLVKL